MLQNEQEQLVLTRVKHLQSGSRCAEAVFSVGKLLA